MSSQHYRIHIRITSTFSIWQTQTTTCAAARQVGTIGKHLHRNVVLAADLLKNRAGQAAGGIFLAGIDFDHNALAQNDLVAGVSLISKIGVHGVGIIGAEHKAVGKCLGLCHISEAFIISRLAHSAQKISESSSTSLKNISKI